MPSALAMTSARPPRRARRSSIRARIRAKPGSSWAAASMTCSAYPSITAIVACSSSITAAWSGPARARVSSPLIASRSARLGSLETTRLAIAG